jgi:hypothetical protein
MLVPRPVYSHVTWCLRSHTAKRIVFEAKEAKRIVLKKEEERIDQENESKEPEQRDLVPNIPTGRKVCRGIKIFDRTDASVH